jgi:hypothetical protein
MAQSLSSQCHIEMAMSTLYLHSDFCKDAHHSKVFTSSNLGPTSIRWRSMASLRISRNYKRGGQGPGPQALARTCPWAQALAASSAVPGDPKAAHGSPAYAYGTQVANENLAVVDLTDRTTQGNEIDTCMARYLQPYHCSHIRQPTCLPRPDRPCCPTQLQGNGK